ncbi:SRPBCC family protein [Afifella sp. IM 167]|uniref:SRPBCC family protein n=1 Tax=Afifella sp. IM 167 TaxID=2033586 RepID=UPI001CCCDCB1|nr:SRPBCC family protein [Afifella sp. IM 167]MBZ8134770.1 carbon monoxide dehydrogenase [Afifella sp. IM 167]
MPQINQEFLVAHPRRAVWERFQDLPEVVRCLPGATLTEQTSPTSAKGVMTVKLGPVRASFAGEADIEADEESWTGTIDGKGMDKSHASRAKAKVVYVLEEADEGAGTVVKVTVDYTLSGSLAQFARGGVVDAIADQITEDFTRNLESELNATPAAGAGAAAPAASGEEGAASSPSASAPRPSAPMSPAPPRQSAPAGELNALTLIWRVFVKKLKALFGR